jgi:hypothetical protein
VRAWHQASAASLPPLGRQTKYGAVQSIDAADPNSETPFAQPSASVKGGDEKLLNNRTERVVRNRQLLEVSIESVECNKRRKYRHQ